MYVLRFIALFGACEQFTYLLRSKQVNVVRKRLAKWRYARSISVFVFVPVRKLRARALLTAAGRSKTWSLKKWSTCSLPCCEGKPAIRLASDSNHPETSKYNADTRLLSEARSRLSSRHRAKNPSSS